MLPLADLQSRLYRAITGGGDDGIVSLLAGPRHPAKRLAIHQRHLETSLVNALLQRFPATVWLVGTPLLRDAALAFTRDHPPAAPCMAEYGRGFARFLAARSDASTLPYLEGFSELEWRLGEVSVEVDAPPLAIASLASLNADELPDLRLKLQPGLRYLMSAWPVDDLMRMFLSKSPPDSFVLNSQPVWLEVRGARGKFDLARLEPAEFSFRRALADGATTTTAADAAMHANSTFDLTAAFSRMFAQNLVVAVAAPRASEPGS